MQRVRLGEQLLRRRRRLALDRRLKLRRAKVAVHEAVDVLAEPKPEQDVALGERRSHGRDPTAARPESSAALGELATAASGGARVQVFGARARLDRTRTLAGALERIGRDLQRSRRLRDRAQLEVEARRFLAVVDR